MHWKEYVRKHRGDLKAASRAYRSVSRGTQLNDVSLLSATSVARVVYPETISDIQRVVKESSAVCVRGTAHSMGGQTLWPDATCIDMVRMTSVKVRRHDVVVGAGLTWHALLFTLDAKGRTVTCMQSYADFSVGGSVSVNAHGPSADVLVNSVKAFVIVRADGRRVTCSRTAHRDLFESALGGYGLFGIIVSVTLLTRPNTLLRQKSFVDALPLSKLLAWYDTQRRDGKVCMYTVRVTTTGEDAFSKAAAIAWEDTSVYAELEAHPLRHVGAIQQVMNTMQRATLSTSIGVWIAKKVMTTHGERDIDSASNTNVRLSMNQLRYQLCEYVTPHAHSPHTFLLFESFLPRSAVRRFLADVRRILVNVTADAFGPIFLLSLYIRFVEPDTTTRLAYAPKERVSFVFYFKVALDHAVEYDAVCRQLVEITLHHKGCFYLPYRVCFTCDQLLSAYPRISSFIRTKRKYDPHGKFTNWFARRVEECAVVDKPVTPQKRKFLLGRNSPSVMSDRRT